MARYDDILRDALTSAPWEARSVNGAQHDRVDWFAVGEEGFPFPLERYSEKNPDRREAEAQGMWGYFELAGQPAAPAGFGEANRWGGAATLPFGMGSPTMRSLRSLMEAARKNRVRAGMERTKPSASALSARGDDADGARGLAALAALRGQARGGEDRNDADTRGDAAAEGADTERGASADAGMTPSDEACSDGAAQEALAALAALARRNAREEAIGDARMAGAGAGADDGNAADVHGDDGAASGDAGAADAVGVGAAGAAAPGIGGAADAGAGSVPVDSARTLLAHANRAFDKRIGAEQRVAVVGVNDPFAAHLLRGCLLASAQAGRALPGLEGVLSERDLEGCAGTVYLSHALCSAEGWSADPDAPLAVETGTVASASLGAFGSSFIPASPAAAPDAQVAGSLAVLDFVGSPYIGDRLPAAFAYALAEARCVIVLAEPARKDLWERLAGLLDGSASPSNAHRTLTLYVADDRVALRSRSQRRFLRAWWRWFGNGSRWGFFELATELDRAMGLLGFNLHQQTYDLGLVSVIAAQIRDGGTITSADDIADALADRFPDRELLQTMVDSAMELLVSEDSESLNERVFVPARRFFDLVERNAASAASILAITAVRSSPSLQTLFRLEGERLEVRFSTMFACLAARWFLKDAALSLLQVADNLRALSRRVPVGGWGRIVLQTVLLAEQRGQTFAGRVILDRLYASSDDAKERTILTEISLGVFMSAADDLPLVWRERFFTGAVNSRQARLLREMRDANWLRDENLLVMRHAVDELYRRARRREDVGIAPSEMIKSCHWMDLLLRALDAESAMQLLDQIAEEARGYNEEARVRALGRYDCLTWACFVGVELPCPSLRSDIARHPAQPTMRDAVLRELAEAGPAYAECARLVWIYDLDQLRIPSEAWEAVRRGAERIIEASAGDDGDDMRECRASAYQVLATCAQAAYRPRPPEAELTLARHRPPAAALLQAARDLVAFSAARDDDRMTYLLMAQTIFGLMEPDDAKDTILALRTTTNTTSFMERTLALFDPNRAADLIIGTRVDDDPPTPSDPERIAELRSRWRACLAALSKDRSEKDPTL